MTTIPATFLMFIATSGHAGWRSIYKATLDHCDRELPLSTWRTRAAHIKILPGEEAIGEWIKKDLEAWGFVVETAVAPWERGQSHYAEYLKDQIKMSQHPAVFSNPFVYWTDQDYLTVCHKHSYERVLHRMIQLVESCPDILSARFLREGDFPSSPVLETEGELFWSPHFNFQPLLMRSRDFHYACKAIEDNWAAAIKMHGEALWREVLKPLSRDHKQHAVWMPDYAEVANLGVSDYRSVAQRFNLSVHCNPLV
jgi:hypothetical protein